MKTKNAKDNQDARLSVDNSRVLNNPVGYAAVRGGGGIVSRDLSLSPSKESARRFVKMATAWHKGNGVKQEIEQRLLFGRCIRSIRRQHNISRQALATQTKLDQELLFHLEQGMLAFNEVTRVLQAVTNGLVALGVNSSSLVCMSIDDVKDEKELSR